MILRSLALLLCLVSNVEADLRLAGHLWPSVRCHWPNAENMKNMHCKYMMPSNFSYRGLKLQEVIAHDNFVRSNIDNEHDQRNFNFEPGKDALPFRTTEGMVYQTHSHKRCPGGRNCRIHTADLRATVKPGASMLVPMRWNNPHSSELEVNIWIMLHDKKPVVVPIRKPTCSGEGYQDNIIKFTIPSDFDKLGSKVPGFKGCNADTKPMCVLQIYSHSVESRTYAIGFPIIIPGHDSSLSASSNQAIQMASEDPGMDLMGLRDLCLPSNDPSADIANAVPRWARLVSDVYNHAYQNSDFSPYSGQQQEFISKNLQASAINKMVVGNRGELGRSILSKDTYQRLKALQTLEGKVYKNYESLSNKVIKEIGKDMTTTGLLDADGTKQQLETCFRCAEVGSIRTNRLETNTYIPSFQVPQALVAKARSLIPSKYSNLISSSGQVQIYVAAMTDLLPFYFVSHPHGIVYQQAMVKDALHTQADVTQFQKNNGRGQYNIDYGVYASTEAKKKLAEKHGCPAACLDCKSTEGVFKPLIKGSQGTCTTANAQTKTSPMVDCSKCPILYDHYQTARPPFISPLAQDVVASGLPGNMGNDQIKDYPDTDGTPRFGRPARPGEKPVEAFTQPQWNLKQPPKTTQPPEQDKPPTEGPTKSPSTRRRRRRRATRRRRGRRGGPSPSPGPPSPGPPSPGPGGGTSRRRRRRRHATRRRRRANSSSGAFMQMLEEVAALL